MFKDNGRKIEISDYIKLAVILVCTIFLCIFIRSMYIKNKEDNNKIPILSKEVNKTIKDNEVYSYINDNATSIIYMCVSNEDKCRDFENYIKDTIKENELKDKLVYLDITNIDDKDAFLTRFNKNYNVEGIVNYPIFIYFKDGKVEDILCDNITKKDFIKFIEKCELD